MPAAVFSCNFHLNLIKLRKMVNQNRLNIFYTVLIFLNHFAYGMTVNLLGSTLVDLRFIFGVSLNTISYLPVATGVGYLLGSLSSYTYRYLNRQLMLIGFVILMAVTTAFVPHYGSLEIALPSLVLYGIGSGAWDSATSIWLVDMWPVGNSAVLQGSQFLYGVGAIVAPFLVSPFVYGDVANITVEQRVKELAIPYEIGGAVQVFVPIILFVLFFVGRYEKPTQVRLKNEESDEEEEENEENRIETSIQEQTLLRVPPNNLHRHIPNRRAKLFLCGLFLATYGTVEIGHFCFSAALFQHLEIHLSAATAAYLLGILSTTYTLGRGLSALISLKLEPDTILSYHFAILFGSLGLLYYGRNDMTLIYVSTAFLGYGFSAFWAAVFAFAERHLRLTDRVCSLFSFLSGAVSLVIPLILGQTFRTWPLVLFYLEFAFLGVSLLLYVWVRIWIAADSRVMGVSGGERRRRRHVFVEGGDVEEHSHIY